MQQMEDKLQERVHEFTENLSQRHSDAEANAMEPTYLLMALGGAILCALATELINWFLIYRHEDYKELTKEIVDSTDKLLN